MERKILKHFYPLDEIFVRFFHILSDGKTIETVCNVPKDNYNTAKPIWHVTAEDYIQCLNQTAYLFCYFLIKNKIVPLSLSETDFFKEGEEYKFYYRKLNLSFYRLVEKEKEFRVRMSLKKFKQIKNLTLLSFLIEKTVISGEISFIYSDGKVV
ncbi:hypothetical protein J7J23_00545 [bacterium]|nr:hypothetical protein [bacterium]